MKSLDFGIRLDNGTRLQIQVTATVEPQVPFDPEIPVEVTPADIAEALQIISRATTAFKPFNGLQITPKP